MHWCLFRNEGVDKLRWVSRVRVRMTPAATSGENDLRASPLHSNAPSANLLRNLNHPGTEPIKLQQFHRNTALRRAQMAPN